MQLTFLAHPKPFGNMSSELITEHRAANSWSDQTAVRRGEAVSLQLQSPSTAGSWTRYLEPLHIISQQITWQMVLNDKH